MAWDDTKTDAVDVLHAADYNEIVSQVKSKIAATDVTYENLNTNGDVGTTSGTVCAGDDSRLSDISSIDGRVTTAEGTISTAVSDISSIDGRVTTLENTAGTDPVMAALIYG